MTDSGLTQKQEDLLVYLVNNKIQKARMRHAMEIYDTKKHAQKGMKRLKNEGFLKKDKSVAAPVYILKGFPSTIKHKIRQDVLDQVS